MAGTYPDIPNPRIEYDRDGTRVYSIIGAAKNISELTVGSIQAINDENQDTTRDMGYDAPYSLLFVFPERRDISHAFIDVASNNAGDAAVKIEWSNDSTTGNDGTWTVAAADFPNQINNTARYRSDIVALAISDVQMVKITTTNTYFHHTKTLHLYGKATTGQNLHRLRLWHPTLDEPLDNHPAHLDWGNVPQNSTDTRQFRVKNDSPNLGASGIKVFMEALSAASPSQITQHQLSSDGTTYVAAATPGVNPGTLAAQQISSPIFLRRNTLLTAQLGLWRQRIVAAADTWT